MQQSLIYRYEFPRAEWDWMHVLGFVYSPQKLAELGEPIYHIQNNPQYYAVGYHPSEDISGRLIEEKNSGGRGYREISGYLNPKPLGSSEGEGVSASDITGWLGKLGGVVSDIFVPGSSVALEMAMDNLGSAIDDYIAMKKSQAQQKAYLKIIADIKANSTFTDWQKNQILQIMNQIQLADTANNATKVKTLKAKLAKLKQGDYHESAQYKQFKQLIDNTGFDAQSKGTLMGWVDEAKNPANDLTDAQRQAKWDDVAHELFKSQQAGMSGQRVQLGNAPTAEQIAAHNAALEKQAGISGTGRRKGADTSKATATRTFDRLREKIARTSNIKEKNRLEDEAEAAAKLAGIEYTKTVHEREKTGKRVGTIGEVMKNKADKARVPPLEKDEITPSIIDEYKQSVNAKINALRGDIEGIGIKARGSQVHSVVFPQNEWTLAQAVKWLYSHGYRAPKVDYEANTMRFRQIDPTKFTRFATKTVDSDGKKINLVIGFHGTRKPKNIKSNIGGNACISIGE